jgi:hypothetical protein
MDGFITTRFLLVLLFASEKGDHQRSLPYRRPRKFENCVACFGVFRVEASASLAACIRAGCNCTGDRFAPYGVRTGTGYPTVTVVQIFFSAEAYECEPKHKLCAFRPERIWIAEGMLRSR